MNIRFSSLCLASASALALTTSGWSADGPHNFQSAASSVVVPQAAALSPGLIFTPIVPCRAFNTPNPVSSGNFRSFQITGSTNFSGQGGPSTGCGVPASAQAVAVTLTVLSPKDDGALRAFADGAPTSQAAVVNYPANTKQTGGAVISLSTAGRIGVFTSAKTRIAGDVTGYFTPEIAGQINPDGSIGNATSRVLSSTRTSTGNYTVTTDRDLTGCFVNSNPYGSGGFIANAVVSGNSIVAYTYSLTNTATSINWQFKVTC